MANFEYSPAKVSDCVLLSTLFKTVYIETYGTEGVTQEFVSFMEQQFSKQKISNDIESKNHDLLVAYFNDNPVGVIQVEYNRLCPVNNFTSPEINKLYVLRNFYGKGVGQNLMVLAEKEIINKGYNQVWLWVLKSNQRANRFYQKQGFKQIGIADFQMDVNTYTNNVMIKEL
jgi:ribosomal protein S18 acetylase RimI-like enzyme